MYRVAGSHTPTLQGVVRLQRCFQYREDGLSRVSQMSCTMPNMYSVLKGRAGSDSFAAHQVCGEERGVKPKIPYRIPAVNRLVLSDSGADSLVL